LSRRKFSPTSIPGQPGANPPSRLFFPLSFLASRAIILAIALAPPLFAQGTGSSSAPQAPPSNQALPSTQGQTAPQSGYVGADTCKTCHEDVYNKSFLNTPHYALIKSGKHGCEDCHGPGAAHVEGGGDITKIVSFKKLSTEEASKRCLTCHAYGNEHANFLRSSHLSNDVGCLDCHSPHHAKEPAKLLITGQPQLCYGCHTEVRAEFSRPFRHRVSQGLLECTDCHNEHGGFAPKQLRTSDAQDQVCFKCHREKKGPFVFEHVPVKTEGCTSCHTPHGSTNPRLLKVSQVNLLCLQCHTLAMSDVPSQPPIGPAHNQSQKYQACTMCHVFIHGSNFSEVFFKP
jgi:DmsE family decaheme c-type cytochrome